jgi:hypothetical protein
MAHHGDMQIFQFFHRFTDDERCGAFWPMKMDENGK